MTLGARPPEMVPMFRVLGPKRGSVRSGIRRTAARASSSLSIADSPSSGYAEWAMRPRATSSQRSAPPEVSGVFARSKERRHRVHVRGERDERIAEGCEHVEPIRSDVHALDTALMFGGKSRQMRAEILAHAQFVLSDGLDVH